MPNNYLQLMEDSAAAGDARFAASTGQALGVNPDQVAASRRVASTLGVAPAVVEAAPELAQRQAQQQQLEANTAEAPTLRSRYSDPEFAKLAHDDSDSLSAFEKLVRAAGDVGRYAVSAPGALEGGLISDVTKAARAVASGVPSFGAGFYGVAAAPFELVGMDHVGGFLRDQGKQSTGVAKAWMGMDPNAGLAQQGVMSGFQSAGQNLAMLPVGMLAAGGEALMLSLMGLVTAGQTYIKGRDAGLSPARAIPHAVEDGFAEAITEKYLGAAGLLQNIKAGATAGKLFMYELAKEVPGEMAATLWQNFNEWMNINPHKSIADFVGEQPAALAETVIATLVGGSTQIGAVKAIEKAVGTHQGREVQAQEADGYVAWMQELLKVAAGSKLRERDPVSFGEFVQQAAEESGHDGLAYVDAAMLNDALAQSGITPEQFAQLSPRAAAELGPLAQSGGTVAIPVGDLVGPLATTGIEQALLPHLRASEESLSQEEAKLVTQQAQQMLTQEAERLTQQVGESAVAAQSATNVKQLMIDQLGTANRFTQDVNEAYASLATAFYQATAARFGITPEEMYAKYPLRVQSLQPAGEAIGQGPEGRQIQVAGIWHPITDSNGRMLGRDFHEQRNFWQWFGNSKAVGPNGAPLVVYHGSNADFTEFSSEHAGSNTQAANARLGHFFTSKPSAAGNYARMSGTEGANVAPTYLQLQNPLRLRAANMKEADKELLDYQPAFEQENSPYDGAIIEVGEGENAQTVYMVRESTQAKSATGNDGSYDANDPNTLSQAAKTTFKTGPALFADIIKKMELTPEEVNSTVIEFMTGLPGDMAFFPPLVGGIPEVVGFLDGRRRSSGLPPLDIKSPEGRAQLARLMAAEALAHIRNAGDSLSWYDQTIRATLAQMAVKYPELNTDAHARNIFLLATAISSQGMNPETNLGFAEEQYAAFRSTGKLPEVGRGEAAPAMAGNFRLANKLLEEMGPELLRRFLITPFTVKELQTAGFSVGGESVGEVVLGSSVFGPKIGFGFYSNLTGNFEPVTMDMWFMRTVGRLTGTLPSFNPEKFANQLTRFRDGIKVRGKKTEGIFAAQFDRELVQRARTDQDAAMELARLVKSAHERDFKTHRAEYDSGKRTKSEMVAAADTMIISMDKPRDVPGSGGERQLLRDVVRQMVTLVEQHYGQRIPPAALQALIWYPEQELYSALGVGLAVTSQDYSGAATKLLRKDGVNEQDLESAIASAGNRTGSVGARPVDGTTDTGATRPDGQGAGGLGPLQGDERARFLAERAARAQSGDQSAAQAGATADSGELSQSGVPGQGTHTGTVGGSRGSDSTVFAQGVADGQRDTGNGSGRDQSRNLAPLAGAPSVPGFHGPDPRIVQVAEQYARDNGIPLGRQAEYARVDPERAARIAAAYEAMQHAPQDPAVKAAYEDLIRQTVAQYRALEAAGYKFWFIDLNDAGNQQYASTPWNAMRDMRANQQMGVFPTAEGFGTSEDFSPEANPLLADTGIQWPFGGPNGELRPVLANDLFRAVHDAFGHGIEGAGFRAEGEENAWQAHARLFTGPALGAITTETRGQNSWLNFGPHGESNRTAKVEDTVFADQKTGLMPEWTWSEGRVADQSSNFGEWFGDSKVVDGEGRPLVVYHGTQRASDGIERFGDGVQYQQLTGGERGESVHWFTSAPKTASNYAEWISAAEPGGVVGNPTVYPAYLSLQNPAGLDDLSKITDEDPQSALYDPEVVAKLKAAGFDGAMWTNTDYTGNSGREGDNDRTVVAFNPEQIKSATGNDGTFDANDPSILSQSTGRRGTFSPKHLTITLLEKADLSTFLHETGHFFLEAMADMATQPNAPADIGRDMLTVLEWFGVRSLDEWNTMTLDQQRPYHEKFAESFEQYLFEGKAPSRELAGLFGRFRAWMTNVYQSLQQFMAGYNTQLSDEVRAVFDRLIATQEQIEQAEQDAGFADNLAQYEGKVDPSLLAHLKGLTEQAREEALASLQSRSLRDLRWLVNARSRELKRLQKDVVAKREAVEKEVTAEVDATPEMRAAAHLAEMAKADPALKDERKDWRDRRAAAKEGAAEEANARYLQHAEQQGLTGLQKAQYLAKHRKQANHEAAGALLQWEEANPYPKRPSTTSVQLDAVAEEFGYPSGAAMLQAIDAYGERKVAIQGITDQRMLERYGELATKEGVQKAANEAVHNEARARAVAAEMQALDASTKKSEATGKTLTANTKAGKVQYQQTTNVIVKAAKRFAEQLVARRKVGELRPGQHAAAERRAAKKALEAAAGGKSAEAMAAKRDQLLNFYAAKETTAAIEEVQKSLKYLKGVADSETLDPDYREQIQTILARFDLRQASAKDLARRATLVEWVEQQRAMGVEPSIPEGLLDEAQRRNYKQLTVEEFRGLVDAVKQIEHLGRLKHKLLTAKDNREFAAVVQDIVGGVIAHAQGRKDHDNITPNTVLGKALKGLKSFGAEHIKAATWARIFDGGKDGGPVWEYLIRPANEAGNKEVTMRAQAANDLAELVAPLLEEGGKMSAKMLVPGTTISLNRQARIAVALNMGNASNTQRLVGGNGWTMDDLEAIAQTLTESEWRVVQKIWDYFESYRPEISAKEKRVSGTEPKWIEPRALELTTADGKDIKLRGGYYPVKYDPLASHRAEEHITAEEAKQQMRAAYTSATTRRSFTKDRAEEVNGRPLLLSLDGIYQGINEVIHDLSWHEFLIDANRLVKNEKIAAAIRQKYGAQAHQQFTAWLKDVAVGETSVAGESFAGWVRQGVSIAGLGFNVMSAAIQPLGITQSIPRIGAKWVGRGVARFASNPSQASQFVKEKSSFMENRTSTRLRELAEVKARIQGRSKVRETIDDTAYFLMMHAQLAVDIPTWIGAYEKAVVEGGNDDATAVQLADQAVIDSQGNGSLKDQAMVERGGQFKKLLTVFYSFFNTTLNNVVAQSMTRESKAKLAADYLLLTVVPVVLGAMLKDAITPGDSGDWDDWKKISKKLIGEQISFMMGLMFGVREFSGAAQAVTGTGFGSDYSGPAGVRLLADSTKLGKQLHQGEWDTALRKAIINVVGEVARLPSGQVNRTWNGVEALRDGKTKNPLALITGYQEPHH